MGSAYFIVLERNIDGLDTAMDGKNLARHIESLDEAARQLNVRPLSEFFSADPVQVAAFLEGEGMDAGEIELPPLQQFTAQEGLETVRALVSNSVELSEGVVQDLEQCERILNAAAQHRIGWHFEVDF